MQSKGRDVEPNEGAERSARASVGRDQDRMNIALHRIYRIGHQKTSDIGKWLVPSMTNQTGGMHHM